MRSWCLSIATAALLANGARAEQVVLEPSSKWVLDYGETRCRLARTYGEGENRSVLYLEQYAPGSSFSWTVAGPLIERMRRSRNVSVQFAPGFAPLEIDQADGLTLDGFGEAIAGRSYKPSKEYSPELTRALAEKDMKKARLLATQEEVELPDDEGVAGMLQLDSSDGAQIEALVLSQKGSDGTVLQLGNMRPVFEAMNTCVVNLATHWGLDPAVERAVVERPDWTNAKALVRRIVDRYPRAALNRGEQANFQLRVMVGADGKLTGCDLTELTSAANFSDEVCPLMLSQAEFSPARNAEGEAVPSYYISRVLYRIR